MQSRRKWLKGLGAMTALGVPAGSWAQQDHGPVLSRQQQFLESAKQSPWLNAYRSAVAPRFEAELSITGHWPEKLRGTLYRNGPALHDLGTERYRHWFDGDGLFQSFELGGGTLRHQARLIETPKLKAERAAGRRIYPGFDYVPDVPGGVSEPDDINPANISVLAHHERLYALWEAGSAIEVDPADLSTLGVRSFSEATSGVAFSAHPRLDRDGSLWNFGYLSSAGAIVIWNLSPSGTVRSANLLRVGATSLPHDMVLTDRYLVLLLPPLHLDPSRADNPALSFLDLHRWHPELPTRVLVISKQDPQQFQTLELPPQWVFHFGNGYEDGDDLVFHGLRAETPALLTGEFRAVMKGERGPEVPAKLYEYRLTPGNGKARETALFSADSDGAPDRSEAAGGLSGEFPSFDARRRCQRYDQLVMLTQDDSDPTPHGLLNQLSVVRLEDGSRRHYSYPISQLPEEHLFVPDESVDQETRGWVIGTAYDYTQDRTLLNLFDVAAVEEGPIASATLPYGLPLGLHGTFVTA